MIAAVAQTAPPAQAAGDDRSWDIGEVVVVEDAPAAAPTTGDLDATGFATVIRTDELPSRVATVPEVLDQAAGVTVRQYGGPGSFSTMSIRGSSAEQVVIYLDGIQLNRAQSGVVNLADIPLDTIEKIEIYRGTSPAKFGAAGIGGVVNIVTKKEKEPLTARAAYTFGSFQTHKGDLALGTSADSWYANLFYTRMQSRGDFEFKDNRGTTYTRSDDRWTHRRNNDFTSDSLLAKAGLDLPGLFSLDVQSDLFKKREGIPGIENYQSEHARLRTFRALNRVRLSRRDLFVPGLDAAFTLSCSFQRQKFKDPEDEIGLGRQDNRDDTENLTAGLVLSWLAGRSHNITLLAEVSRETYESRDRLAANVPDSTVTPISHLYGFTGQARAATRTDPGSDEQKRRTWTAAIEDEIYLFGDRVLIAPSLKYTRCENDFQGTLPFSATPIAPGGDSTEDLLTRKLGLAVFPCDVLTIKANVGRYHRLPNFYELFGDRGAVVGNTDLVPEDSLNWDVGLTLQGTPLPSLIRSCTLEYSWFSSEVDNLILFIQNSQRTSIARNISRARITGHELFWQVRLRWPVRLSGNYTVQDARDRSSVAYWRGNRLPGRPRYELFNRTEIFSDCLTLFHEVEFVGRCFLDRANLREISGRTFQNAGLSWKPTGKTLCTVEVKNFTDRHGEDVAGYPLPGRSFYATVEIRY